MLIAVLVLSLQEVKRGDEYLEKALLSGEDIDMDFVYLAVDVYRHSILLTR